jgi:hypothetical protein
MVMTNEDPTNPNKILLQYLKNFVLGLNTAPSTANSKAFSYWIERLGLYFVEGLMNNPVNPY